MINREKLSKSVLLKVSGMSDSGRGRDSLGMSTVRRAFLIHLMSGIFDLLLLLGGEGDCYHEVDRPSPRAGPL